MLIALHSACGRLRAALRLATLALALGLGLHATPAAAAEPFTPEQKAAIEKIIKDYLLANPEVMLEIQQALEARMEKIQQERAKLAILENREVLFRRADAPMTGNPKGDVVVVEFFDYNCGYCRRALKPLAELVKKDPNVKVVFKELPILSKGSNEAARVALAARLQGKYWELHRAMLESSGQLNEASSLKIAEKIGLDVARLKKDMSSEVVTQEINQIRELAQKMGIQGTPYFLVGDRVIAGAPDDLTDVLQKHIADVRKEGCKVC